MSRWFRFYDGALDDPKVQALPGDLFKVWVNLLCVASRHGGCLPVAELPFYLRADAHFMAEAVERLKERGLVDFVDEYNLAPHNWDKRQFQSDNSTERVKRYRNKQEDVTETVTVTPPETEQNTETEKKIRRKAPRRISYPPGFEEFWKGYPTDPLMSKSEAFTEWQNLSPEDQEAAIAALSAFKAATAKLGPDHRVIHACRYLKKRRFDGFRENLAKAAEYAQAAAQQVFVQYGTDAGDAWAARYRADGKVPPGSGTNGWWFPSEYPPDHVCRETSDPLPTPQQTEKAA